MSISSSISISISIFLFLTLIPATFSLTFEMSPITTSDAGSLILTGDADIDDEGIQVTTNKADAMGVGRATYADQLHLWDEASNNLADLSTRFSFVIDSSGSSDTGYGLAFFIAPKGSTIRPWSYGGGLGLGNLTTPADSSSLDTFVAVEFDTFSNPNYGEQESRHVGIDLNNLNPVTIEPWCDDLSAGSQNDALISYNSITKMMSVDFTCHSGDETRQYSLTWEVDLRDYLPEYVTVGFSAATGASFEKHNVKSWSFSSTELSSSSSEDNPSRSPLPQVVSDGGNDSKLIKNSENNSNKKLVFGLTGMSVVILASAASAIYYFLRCKKTVLEGLEKGPLSDSAMDIEIEKGSERGHLSDSDMDKEFEKKSKKGRLSDKEFEKKSKKGRLSDKEFEKKSKKGRLSDSAMDKEFEKGPKKGHLSDSAMDNEVEKGNGPKKFSKN